MGLLSGQFLTVNSFSWPAGQKKDGSTRVAGEYVAFYVYEDGPTPALSPVVEVQVPDNLKQEFQAWQLALKKLAPVKIWVEHTGRGKARLQGFSA